MKRATRSIALGLFLALALVFVTAGAAIAANWPQYAFNSRHTGFNAAETTLSRANVSGLGHAFGAPTVPNAQTTSAIVAGGVLFVASGDQVRALDATTGASKWKRLDCSAPAVATSLAFAAGRVWVGDDGGDFAGYDAATGVQAFCDDFSGSILNPPAAAAGVLYVGNNIGDLFAVDATTATVVWGINLNYEALNTPAVAGGNLYVSTAAGHVFKLQASDGSIVWKRNIDTCCLSAVTVWHSALYIGGSALHSIDPASGAVNWTATNIGADTTTPAVAGGKVFVGAEDPLFGIAAFDAATGARLWLRSHPGELFAPVSVANGVAYVVADRGDLEMFNTDTGAFLAAKANPSGIHYNASAGVTVVNGTVFVPTGDLFGLNVIDAWTLPTTRA